MTTPQSTAVSAAPSRPAPSDGEECKSSGQGPAVTPVDRPGLGGIKRQVLNTRPVAPIDVKKPKLHESSPTDQMPPDETLRYFEVVWRKHTTKKNKTWDGDGVAILGPTFLSFRLDQSDNYKEKSRISNTSKFTTDGCFSMGSFELEVMMEITDKAHIDKIRSFTKTGAPKADSTAVDKPITRVTKVAPIKREQIKLNKQFKQVVPHHTPIAKPKRGEPLYDASDPSAILFKKADPSDTDVLIDPFVAKKLRPHQVKGVKFLYECTMGLRGDDISGALLADDMGLGKTLQTITLIWTLLKQSPQGCDRPVANKVLIACPVTLIANWKREFNKWLPMNRIGVLTLSSKGTISRDKDMVKGFARANVYQVLIMGYEKILNMKEELSMVKFDLLICDEGHRLKNNTNKTLQALNSFMIERKVLLSGTPIQNDLSEFFNVIDFINPGILGTFNQFKRNFMNPILVSRDINCFDESARETGEAKSQELIALTKPFILRRTASVISNHLPPRTDIVLFCPPTNSQVKLFNEVLSSHRFTAMVNNAITPSSSLGLITMFKKICNSPSLLKTDKIFQEINVQSVGSHNTSGKLLAFQDLLMEIYRAGEKVVVVSNYTQTLDILQDVISKLNLTFLRLDGSTPKKDRDSIVNTFNNAPQRSKFAFLLSSKSGGVGLNLIGASRLILFDNDWNPSVDLQAMARVHRDGQKRPVFIYRLITTGCIDEKIFQRQLMKNNLSDKFLDNKSSSTDNLFEVDDLKDLFTVNQVTKCNTHDLIECSCGGTGEDTSVDDSESDEEPEKKVPSLKREASWVSALEVKNTLPEEDAAKKATIKKCLKDYRHIDPSKINLLDCNVGDELIEKVLTSAPKAFTFILTKVNKPTL